MQHCAQPAACLQPCTRTRTHTPRNRRPPTADFLQADFFYVPISYACLFDVYGWNPMPRWPKDVQGRERRGGEGEGIPG